MQVRLFMMLIITLLLIIGGVREIRSGNYAMGSLLFGIPACGWISIWIYGWAE